ncbi:hypothetical protein PG991_000700 [Apiospora marii]|uniref:Uncharacterized protein n=1 Tax=Apiospora marii TaxID=335849 RepID=A0ABR1SUJ1_9PEZI
MKFSWSQALPVAILALEVSAGKKCQHNPSALSSASLSSFVGVTTTSSEDIASSSSSTSSSLTTSSASSSTESSSTESSSTESSSSSASTTSSELSTSSSFTASSSSSSATLTQSSASVTTLSSSIILDKCSAGLLGTTGLPDRASRLADCSALNMVTVTPPTQTTTEMTYTTSWSTTVTVTESGSSPAPVIKRMTAAAAGVTATGLDGTVTVRPTGTPLYAGAYCDSYEGYYSACSDGGVLAQTTTAPAQTATATSTVVIPCMGSYIFTQYLGIPFPTMFIPGEIPQPTTIIVGGDAITTSIVGSGSDAITVTVG